MFQEFEIRVTGFQRLALLHALSGLLDQAEVQRIHRIRSADPIPVRVPGCLSGVDEELLPFTRDPRLDIRQLGRSQQSS
jgi:hypothetical protein